MNAVPTRPERRSLIVLDRDGVINRDSPDFIKSPAEWIALPGSPAAIAQLTAAGFTVVVATNQSGIARGLFSPDILTAIHEKMLAVVKRAGGHIDAIHVCPHGPDDGCECRKPGTGLLRDIANAYARAPGELIVIGDSLRDLESAWAFGAEAVLVRTGNGAATERSLPAGRPVSVFDDLAAAAQWLVG